MIHLATGKDVKRLIDSLRGKPALYRNAVLCSPFIDAEMLSCVSEILRSPASNVVTIITGPAAARNLKTSLGWHPHALCKLIVVPHRLHAKVYVGVTNSRQTSEAIVTSANLTRGGLESNLEVGVRAVPDCSQGARLLYSALDFVKSIIGTHRICG
jgi:hypothetical protein